MNGPARSVEMISEAGAVKTRRFCVKTFILAIFAGMFIAFGAFASQAASVDFGGKKLVGALVFPAGLFMVVLTGAELFTGNNMLVVSLLDGKATAKGIIKNLSVVYAGNFVGSVAIAFMTVYGGAYSMFGSELAKAAVSAAQGKVSLSPFEAAVKGVLCNILVCVAIWISYAAEDVIGKMAALYLPVMLFVASGFEHSVANMFFIPAGIFASKKYGIPADSLTWGAFALKNLLPVTVGNMIGGMCVVSPACFFLYLGKPRKAEGKIDKRVD